ncbi:MAG: hypothetical protein ACLGIR_11780 [Actinomycetes bacterium]|jgi:hypothetical protein
MTLVLSAALAGCNAPGRGAADADIRQVRVDDARGDVQPGRLDGGSAPVSGVDLGHVSLRDVGTELLVEFGRSGPVEDAADIEGAERRLLYVLRIWGANPDERFTVYAAVAGNGRSGSTYLCDVIRPLDVCTTTEAQHLGSVLDAGDETVTFEIPWQVLGNARIAGFRWLGSAQLNQVKDERWDEWFDDVPDRAHPIPTVTEPTIVEGLLPDESIDPPAQAAVFPALVPVRDDRTSMS